MRWTARGLSCLLLAATPACAEPARQVWFGPNLASVDLAQLFTRPEQWRGARGSTDVLQLYAAQVLAARPGDCAECGPNTLAALREAGAFSRLRQWGLRLALEVGVIKGWGCTAELTAAVAGRAVANVEAAGGTVRYLAMDEPLLGSEHCELTPPEAAGQVALFTRRVHGGHPGVGVGLIEPYPRYAAGELVAWLAALRQAGAVPAFFHLDVDRRHAERLQADVTRDLRLLSTFCEANRIPFGVILWSPEASSDRAYFEDTLAWARTVRQAIGEPAHLIVQSWAQSPGGARDVPTNLPEGDPQAFTHTRLLLEALRVR